MSKAKDLYDEWCDLRDETNKATVNAIVECSSGNVDLNKLRNILEKLNFNLEHHIKKSREIFDHDERRVVERNNTINYLQDKLAEKSTRNNK